MGAMPRAAARSAGFTLIEILVALVVLSIGLLGMASLQTQALRSSQAAYLRSQAAILAVDMAERMRANLKGVKAGYYNDITLASAPAITDDCLANLCSESEMARFDQKEWFAALQRVLPSPRATVQGNGSFSVFTIRVEWRKRAVRADAAAPDAVQQFYEMSVIP